MFKCYLESNALSTFRSIIDVISTVTDEAKFIATQNGLSMQAIDHSNILLVDLFISNGFFKEYQCDDEVIIGLRIPDLNKLLKRSSSEDAEVKLEEKTNKVSFKFLGKVKRTHKLKLFEILEDNKIPPNSIQKIEPQLESAVELFANDVKFITGDAALYSDALILTLNSKQFLVRASGDVGEYDLEIDLTEDHNVDVKGETTSTYALQYFTNVLKAASLTDKIKVKFSSNKPILLEFPFEEASHIKFLLAPRVEEEDEEDFDDDINDANDDIEFD
ncbi:MAG: proliferating cell nuclear antigen (pcna) [Candidatus Helarchaeota archaeon]